MVNNIPVGVIKQAAAVGFHWQGKHNQQRLTALGKKCQLRVQYLFFPENVIRNVNFCFSVLCLSGEKFFSILSGAQQTQFQTQSPRNCIVIGKTK